jgi:hypothetical protein
LSVVNRAIRAFPAELVEKQPPCFRRARCVYAYLWSWSIPRSESHQIGTKFPILEHNRVVEPTGDRKNHLASIQPDESVVNSAREATSRVAQPEL